MDRENNSFLEKFETTKDVSRSRILWKLSIGFIFYLLKTTDLGISSNHSIMKQSLIGTRFQVPFLSEVMELRYFELLITRTHFEFFWVRVNEVLVWLKIINWWIFIMKVQQIFPFSSYIFTHNKKKQFSLDSHCTWLEI